MTNLPRASPTDVLFLAHVLTVGACSIGVTAREGHDEFQTHDFATLRFSRREKIARHIIFFPYKINIVHRLYSNVAHILQNK
jgi:hypothetical protein